MVSVCLPSDALSQHLPSHLGFSYLGRGVALHGCEGCLLTAAVLTLHVGKLLSAPAPALSQPGALCGYPWPWVRASSSQPCFCAVHRSRRTSCTVPLFLRTLHHSWYSEAQHLFKEVKGFLLLKSIGFLIELWLSTKHFKMHFSVKTDSKMSTLIKSK